MSISNKTSKLTGLPGKILVYALLLGVLATYLFFQNPLGISVPVFIITGFLILISLAWQNNIIISWKNAWLIVPIIVFAAMVAVRANGFITFLNITTILVLCLLFAFLFQSGNILKFGVFNYFSAGIISGFEIGILKPSSTGTQAWQEAQKNGGVSPQLSAVFRGLFMATPVIILFTILFSSADAAFELAAKDFLKLLRLDNIPELFSRFIFTVIAAWLCMGGIAYSLRETETGMEKVTIDTHMKKPLGLTETAVILISLNVLFAVFVAIQFQYFFGGQQNISVAGFTYAEYTRRGFAELVFVAIFTLALCLVLQTLMRVDSKTDHSWFEGLVVLLILMTGVVLVSSFQRLMLYEQAYGWTQLRTYVHVFIICLGALLLIFLFSVHFSNSRIFAFGLFITCMGFVMGLNVLNPDAFIARQNIARYAANNQLDVVYLATLSEDAIPELLWLLDVVNSEDAQVIGGALHDYLNRLEAMQTESGWQSWNWSRTGAYQSMMEARPKLEQYPAQRYYWNFPVD